MAIDCLQCVERGLSPDSTMQCDRVRSVYISACLASAGWWHQNEWQATGEQLYRCPLSAASWSNVTALTLTDSSQQMDVNVWVWHLLPRVWAPLRLNFWRIINAGVHCFLSWNSQFIFGGHLYAFIRDSDGREMTINEGSEKGKDMQQRSPKRNKDN